jgi:ferredoxin like protein
MQETRKEVGSSQKAKDEFEKVSITDRLALNIFNIDKDPHIKIKKDCGRKCDTRPCIIVCPADCFKEVEGEVVFSYEGCLECGTCRIVCGEDALSWSYPRSGFGIQYRLG